MLGIMQNPCMWFPGVLLHCEVAQVGDHHCTALSVAVILDRSTGGLV